jgi:outer membrane protein TolC
LKDAIDRGLRTLEQRRQNYIIQKNALELANRRVLSNELLIQAGRAEARDLVEAQNDQIQAQNAVTLALVSYLEIRLQLLQNIGVIETQSDDFWFKNHLEDVPEIAATADTLRELPRDTLPNPAEIFSN